MLSVHPEKKMCCGCSSCANVCPKNAITMDYDEFGIIYPVINPKKCIGCKLCQRVCDFSKHKIVSAEPTQVYAVSLIDDNLKMKSASGGVFATLAKNAIENGGVIAGAIFENEEDCRVKHILTGNLSDIEKIQGSKYSQSEMGDIYIQIDTNIRSGRKVLFSGTPCQVAAVKSYFKDNTGNLFLVDIICHGVPGTKMFADYIREIEKHYNGKICQFKFRDKSYGWDLKGSAVLQIKEKMEKKISIIPGLSSYYHYFLTGDIYRDSCYECKYACPRREGDITIGDFWGIEKQHPEYLDDTFDINRGISCVLVNSEKGKFLLKCLESNCIVHQSSFSSVTKENGQLLRPSVKTNKRDLLFSIYEKEGFIGINQFYMKELGVKKPLTYIWNHLPQRIRRLIKRH